MTNQQTTHLTCRVNGLNVTAGKSYRVIPDAAADAVEYVRVIDDSGEDYLHPRLWFREGDEEMTEQPTRKD